MIILDPFTLIGIIIAVVIWLVMLGGICNALDRIADAMERVADALEAEESEAQA